MRRIKIETRKINETKASSFEDKNVKLLSQTGPRKREMPQILQSEMASAINTTEIQKTTNRMLQTTTY